MFNLILILILICNCFSKSDSGIAMVKSVEKTLIRTLIERFAKNAVYGRPVNDSREALIVEHKFQLIQILDLDENKQVLKTNCWTNLRWKDSLLVWNPEKYANITSIRVLPDQIWTPDIMLYNFADERMKDKRDCRVKVFNDGTVLWVPQSLFKSTCSVEITFFPFDSQTCKFEFGSWTYDITKLDIVWWQSDNITEDFIDHSAYMSSNEWQSDGEKEFLNNSGHQQSKAYKIYRFSASLEQKDDYQYYPVLRYILRLKRNPSFYISILIFPCILLSLLTLVVFWLPPESPAKLMIGMSIFVAFFVLLLLLAGLSPTEVKNFPLIGMYFCLNMMMITMSAALSTLVINIHFKGAKAGPLPKFVRRIIVDGLGSFVLIRQNIDLPTHKSLQQKYLKRIGLKQKKKINNPVWSKNIDKNFRKRTINSQSVERERLNLSRSSQPELQCEAFLNAFIQGHLEFERDIREINRYTRILVNRDRIDVFNNLIAMEYRTLALVLDRLFFIMYITIVFTSVFVCYSKAEIVDHELRQNISHT